MVLFGLLIVLTVQRVRLQLWKILRLSSLLGFWLRRPVCDLLLKSGLCFEDLLLCCSQLFEELGLSSLHLADFLVVHLCDGFWLFVLQLVQVVFVVCKLLVLLHPLVSHADFVWNYLRFQVLSMLFLHFVDLMSNGHACSKGSVHLSFYLQPNSVVFFLLLSNSVLKLLFFDLILSVLAHKLGHLVFSPSLLCFTLRLLLRSQVVQLPHSFSILFDKLLGFPFFVFELWESVFHLLELHLWYFLFH